ncbi:MAG: 4Fe-4S binding protein, partial [Bacteroidota bacterium]
MKREIIKIDEDLCNGCGECIPNCPEGALQIIDNKAVLISDLMCDGLGACIGHCPEDAITIEKREALPYDETAVIKEMISKGKNVIVAHLKHLKEHGETGYLKEAVKYLEGQKDKLGFSFKEVINEVHNKSEVENKSGSECGCPGAMAMSFGTEENKDNDADTKPLDVRSELRQWPV